MKKILTLFLLLLSAIGTKAQMAEWLIRPNYDSIRVASGASLLLCDSLDNSYTSIWTFDGEHLAIITDSIHSFNDGYALITKKGTDEITGFIDEKGNFVEINGLSVAHNMPSVSCGYLVAYYSKYNSYKIITTAGKLIENYCLNVYPFMNNYAVVEMYDDYIKQKDLHYRYLTSDCEYVKFKYEKEVFDYKDVRFLTSVTDEGIAYAVINNDLYSFDANTKELQAVTSNSQDNNPKKQVSLVEQSGGRMFAYINDTICLSFKNRKTERVHLFLDERLTPLKIRYSENGVVEERFFAKKVAEKKVYDTQLSILKDTTNSKYAIMYQGNVALPAQFVDATLCVGNNAVVRLNNGKWGVLNYDEQKKYEIKINEEDPIGFRHRFYKTKIRLIIPTTMSSDKCDFTVDEESGCIIDRLTGTKKASSGGNWVEYDCKLSIPQNITDGNPQPFYYPVKIVYDEIEYPIYNAKIRAWHRKYINVRISDKDENVTKGDVSFKIYLETSENGDYPLHINVFKANSENSDELVQCYVGRINDEQYQCRLEMLSEGENIIYVYVTEEGCPPQITPFVITYIKPVNDAGGSVSISERPIVLPL